MNADIAKERISYVVRPDSITSSEGDFLATHVSVKKLKVLDKFELSPSGGKSYTEEELFKNFISNPEDKHQFIAVYGQSGTGKSHLIRWFEARYEQNKPKDEVILFIRRSDNTLKGTIRQLLEKPEVQDISNKEVYERLVKASLSVEENKLKDMIYHNFIIEINNDSDEQDIKLPTFRKKKLMAFLNNEVVHDYLMSSSGPVERMYSKIAENTLVDRDTVAQFEANDFIVSSDLYDNIINAGADPKAESMAKRLMSDEEGPAKAKKIADYLNQFVGSVIQRCAGIEPGDFKQIFLDIRKELYRLDKKLTLFIEDVTSFTGVDTALLDALIEEHTGKRESGNLCRISSIVGTTNNYLEKNFKDNHKDRITKYIYIPSDVLDESDIYEFVAKYINTMSLSEDSIDDWLSGHANPEDYPIHDVVEGKKWEFIDIGYNKKISIYPFTKKSIMYFYNYVLQKGHQTPRYIIKNIIEPVVRDAIFNKEEFPSLDILYSSKSELNRRINTQITDQNTANRILKFINIWGNGSPEQYEENGTIYIAGMPREAYDDFNFPSLNMDQVDAPVITNKAENKTQAIEEKQIDTVRDTISLLKKQKLEKAYNYLSKWVTEHVIDIEGMAGASGTVHSAIYDEIPDYLYSAINWQAEGVTTDNAKKVRDSSLLFVALEGQTKNEGLYVLPANWNSVDIILAFIRWKEYGKQSWNYPEADFDAYMITTWTESIKKELVSKVKEYKPGVKSNYIDAAIVGEIYRTILAGEFREKTLKNFTIKELLASKPNKHTDNSHCKEWNSLLNVMNQKNAASNNKDTVRKYFNIDQGGGSTKIVLDYVALTKTFSKIKRNHLEILEDDRQADDRVKLRRDAYVFLNDIEERVERVAKAELELGREKLEKIFDAFGDDEIGEEELAEFVNRAKRFFEEANKTQINVKECKLEGEKKLPTLAKAISNISSVLDEKDPLTILMAFAGDPIAKIKPLLEFIDSLENEVRKAKNQIAIKKSSLMGFDGVEEDELYIEEKKNIVEYKEKLERMVNA